VRLHSITASGFQRFHPECLDNREGGRAKSPIMPDNESLAARGERAEQIKRKPELYKVCEGCESIVVAEAATCPNCHGYRFDDSTARVREQADVLGKRLPTSVPPSELM
jgi:hypothetical protein